MEHSFISCGVLRDISVITVSMLFILRPREDHRHTLKERGLGEAGVTRAKAKPIL